MRASTVIANPEEIFLPDTRSFCGITLLYAVNMYSSHWLMKRLIWLIARQNEARWESHTEVQGERRVESYETEISTQDTTHKLTGKATATGQYID